ncbi:MAG: cytochrome c family protein [Magnetococcales bacterium]|nr:cytochrome c family protein [Magnetococcales bacterium]
MKKFTLLLVGLLAFLPLVQAAEKPALSRISSKECGQCHTRIYRQWSGSVHARSTALQDAIHAFMYKAVMGDPTQEDLKDKAGNYPVCLQCHAPVAAREGKTKLDGDALYDEGVNCVTCHTMERHLGVKTPEGALRPGAKAYAFSSEALQGPNGAPHGQAAVVAPGSDGNAPTTNPYSHVANPALFKSSGVCLGCHELLMNPQGVPVCTIGDKLLAGESPPTCQSCHMPVVDGVADHSMPGGHEAAMVKSAVNVAVSLRTEGESILATVSLENTILHTFPNGAPFRNVRLQVSGLDAGGNVVWKNPADDPNAVLMLKLVDEAGQPAMPMAASRVAADTRLQPGETRTLTYTLPAKEVVLVRAELFHNLVTKPMLEKLGESAPEEARKPVLAGSSEARPQ